MQEVFPSQVVAVLLRFFPDAASPAAINLRFAQLPQLMTIVKLVRRIPSELFTVSIESYALLEQALETIEQSLSQHVYSLPPVEDTDTSAVQVIYSVLVECSDTFPASSSIDLTFVPDNEIRYTLSADIGAVERAYRNYEWTSATVLAGATIEALLLWRLQLIDGRQIDGAIKLARDSKELKGQVKKDVNEWHLPELIEVAAQLKLLRDRTVVELRQSKDFRNLIHPGRVLRFGLKCTRGTASAALAALDFLVEDLARPPPTAL